MIDLGDGRLSQRPRHRPPDRLPIDLRGTIRGHVDQRRRPFIRFFACEQDLSHDPPDTPLPEAVVRGTEPFLVIGAVAGG